MDKKIRSPANEKHDRMLNVRMSAADSTRLDRVARMHGLSASATIRLLVKQAADRLGRREKRES